MQKMLLVYTVDAEGWYVPYNKFTTSAKVCFRKV